MQRKKPFSHKQKKQQLKEKRRNQQIDSDNHDSDSDRNEKDQGDSSLKDKNPAKKLSFEPVQFVKATVGNLKDERSKLVSVFERESEETIRQRKEESMKPIVFIPLEKAFEVSYQEIYPKDRSNLLSIPRRPIWTNKMTREQLESNEHRYFENWLQNTLKVAHSMQLEKGLNVSFFEQNLEVWRQLWRVCEMSDIVIFVVDIRHPVLHFPPSLYDYVVKELQKPLVLVFTKIDLVANETIFAWKKYFSDQFPGIHVSTFSIYARQDFQHGNMDDFSLSSLQRRVRRQKKRYLRSVGVRDVLSACKNVQLEKHGVQVDWNSLIDKYAVHHEDFDISKPNDNTHDDDEDDEEGEGTGDDMDETGDEEDCDEEDKIKISSVDDFRSSQPNTEWITIGLIGHPNVGKSSLINGIMGKKVVSASRTPGHTKHFQTIHLTPTVRLCDCPGLVFPSFITKPLQILSGMYKIAQVQDPYTSVIFLAERIDLVRLFNLKHPDLEGGFGKVAGSVPPAWSAWDICEAYAIQRGFFTARGGRPDVYRAANLLLRLTADGRILLSFKPPGFFAGSYLRARQEEMANQVKRIYSGCQDQEYDDGDDGSSDQDMMDSDLPDFKEIVDRQGKPQSSLGGAFNALLSLSNEMIDNDDLDDVEKSSQ